MARQEFKFVHALRVRWAEVDMQGIVFNGNYLVYFDVGVTEYYRAIGHPYPGAFAGAGTDLFVKKAEIEYYAPAAYDDVIDICVRVARIGRSSFDFRIEIYRNDELLVAGALVYVNADPALRKSQPLPSFLTQAFLAYETVSPQ